MARNTPVRSNALEWAALFQTAPVGLAIITGPDDRYAFVNDEFARDRGRYR